MTRLIHILALALLTATGRAAGAAQEGSGYLISAWRTDDGLPPLVSPVLIEAPEGYLWMEAESGPVRFDGERFTVFPARDLGWPRDTGIRRTFADGTQGIWLTLKDRSLWRERGGKWSAFGTLPGGEIITMMQPAKDGGMLAGTSAGRLLRCTEDPPAMKEVMPAQVPFSFWQDHADSEGGIWYAAQGGARRWLDGRLEDARYPAPENRNDYIFSWPDHSQWIIGPDYVAKWTDGAFHKLPPIAGMAPQKLAGILPAPPHGVWATTVNRMYFLPEGATEWRGPWPWATRAEQRQLTNLSDVNGHHWIATYGFGFLHVNPEGRQIEERLPPDLAGNRILNFIEDRERNIWAVAEGSGLARLRTKRFRVHRAGDGLSDPEVLAVTEDGAGALWAGSRAGGVDVLREGTWTHLTLPPGDEPAAGVTSLLPLPDGMLAGTSSRGVWKRTGTDWQPLGGKQAVRVLHQDTAGTLWMGGPAGLFRWREGEWRTAPSSQPWPGVTGLTHDETGRLWAATAGGVWRSDAGGRFRPVPPEECLPSEAATCLRAEAGGVMWIGFENGLARWRDGKAVLRRRNEGLPFQRIAGIYPPGKGKLWISSPEGLASLDTDFFVSGPLTARVFTRADGLPTGEASRGFQPSVWRGRDGRFWLPTHLGLVEFDPGAMPPAAPPPPVVIEAAFASFEGRHDDLPVPPATAKAPSTPWKVEPGMRRLEFRFTAPSLSAPENIRFRWRLEGLDTAWSEPSAQRTATYATVPPGRYLFRVLACNGDGVWNETGASVALVIPPLWQEMPAVWVTAAVLAAFLVGMAVRSRYRRHIEVLALRSRLEHERARIAQDIHDDLGATLTQISLWSAFARKGAGEAVAGHLGLIRERAIDAVRSLDQIVWAVNPSNDTVRNFATYLCQMAGDLFRETEMACRIDLQEPVEDGPLHADARHHLVLAAREACTNALRHSVAREVSLRVVAGPRRIFIMVSDNGRGFDPASVTGEGEGLTGMARRLTSAGGRCVVESAPGEGTRVKLEWPASP